MAKEASPILRQEFINSNAKLFTNKEEGLKPQVGDLVLVLKEEPRLGLITKISSPHRVVVRHKHGGSNNEVEYHSRILSLIYRPVSSSFFIDLVETSTFSSNHLLSKFWKQLKLQMSPELTKPPQCDLLANLKIKR